MNSLPLSPMQEGLLYQSLANPGSDAYFVQMMFAIEGDLDAEAFERAWRVLFERHDVLRARFTGNAQELVTGRVPEVARFDGALDGYLARDRARGFDLEREPLMRFALFRTAAREHQLVWSYHHAVLDGWSLGILEREFAEVYRALTAGETPRLPPARSYGAFLDWLQRRPAEESLAYWTRALEGCPAATGIPSSTTGEPSALRERVLTLDRDTTHRLGMLAKRVPATASTLVQALWSTLLARYNDTSDVAFGAVVSGRPAELDGVEEIVGPFINAVPVRAVLHDDETFLAFLARMQKEALQASAHHHLPLAEIQRAAGIALDHVLVFDNYPSLEAGADAGPLTIRQLGAHDRTHYDFSVVVVPGEQLRMAFSYDAAVHGDAAIERLMRHLQNVIAAILAQPAITVGEIPIVDAEERRLLLQQSAGAPAAEPRYANVVQWLEAQAAATPDALAVVGTVPSPRNGGERVRVRGGASDTLTYRELHARIAARARELRVAPGEPVPMMLDRSVDAVIETLAIFKAGGAWLPVDPRYPQERIDGILADARGDTVHDPEVAYILYTSGSTGRPKGCAVTHANLLHYLTWANGAYFESPEEGSFPLFTSLSFDLTITSLFLPLLRGRTLRVFEEEAGQALEEIFSGRAGTDCVKLTPSHIALLDSLPDACSPVKLAIIGGEAVTPAHVRALLRLNPSMRIWNEYGPTEATVGCVVKQLRGDDESVTIGRPIDGVSVHVLDRRGELVPAGIAGELFLSGPNVARGYVHDPDVRVEVPRSASVPRSSSGKESDLPRNSEELRGTPRNRFLDDPFLPGNRMYRTGDVGRWLANGELEYLGRNDAQVKVRGHRVELAEVEAALRDCPGVRNAVVLVRGDALVAWVEGDAPQTGVLRARLPEWMIPSRIVAMGAIPLTAHGKIDKARLPEPERETMSALAPRDALEARLLAIWREVLGVGHVALGDSFAALGGHSLKAMQVTTRIHRELGVRIPLRDFLAAPTLAALGDVVRAARPSPYRAIAPAEPRELYDLSHAQQRLWLLHRMKGDVAYNMPKAYLYEGALDTAALRRALALLIDRQEALRTAFVTAGGEPKQRILDHAEVRFRELDLRAESDPMAAARRIAEEDAVTPFDLGEPPLLRFTALQTGDERWVLVLTMHHIIGDGWSLNVLHRELLALYESCRTGAASTLPPLRIRYRDFAAWQNGQDLAEHERFWLDALRGAPEMLRLPYDFAPAGEERDFRGAIERRMLPRELSAAIERAALLSGTTVANAVLSSFAAALYAVSRQDDFLIGVSSANRNDAEIEALVGFFVNLLPVRVQTSAGMTAGELLALVTARAFDAFEHQDYPFDLLVRKLNPERQTNRQPLLNVVYGFQNFTDVTTGTASTSPLGEARETEIAFRTSKFDLCLFVSRTDDGLLLELEHDTGLFGARAVRRILDAIERAARQLAGEPEQRLSDLALVGVDEERELLATLHELNATATSYPRDRSVPELLAEVAAAAADAIAVRFDCETLTYGQLEERAEAVARFLASRGVGHEERVAVLLERSLDLVVALLGILKCGASYVPLGADVPLERLVWMTADTGARVLVTGRASIGLANKLQWECAELRDVLCLDSDDVSAEIEDGGLMAPEIWDYVAGEAFDDISGGGWKSSYTGDWLSREVMDEYGDNIEQKLAPLVGADSRVLEIGCASGISMFRIAPRVARYYGTDLSPGIVRWSRAEAEKRGLASVRLAPLAAHEIDAVDEREFDVVVLNSVIECFSGHNYLRAVLRKAIGLMKDEGYLFLGNIWDQDLKADFVRSLLEFRRQHPEEGKRAKIDRADELFLSRGFLEDLRFEFPEIVSIDYSTMLSSAESELSRFGFDALLRIEKRRAQMPAAPRRKYQFDRRALREPLPAVTHLPAARDLAYLMYTSGTTGQPKAVMVEHRSIVRLVRNSGYMSLGPDDRVLQAGALGFDASTFEIWGPLLNGGAVVLPRGRVFLAAAELARIIRGEGVTALFLTTGLFNQLVDEDVRVFDGLSLLLTGGEKASAEHFNRVHEAHPRMSLKHVYGPTENTTFSTSYEIRESQPADVPIGRAIANSTAWIFDEAMHPVPFGIPGELYVGGDGLARGYWNRPELTSAKFVAHPLLEGERLYRTGDLARWSAGGNIVFIGRTDTQVKVRGFRIELGEIESALLRHERVAEVTVTASEEAGQSRELAAYVVARSEVDATELRAFLRSIVPDYMVPAHFVFLERLPLNASGKVDRRALTLPRAVGANAGAAASTATEERLVAIWQRVLGRAGIGVDDDFFDLGGHSLKVARMVSLVQKELQAELPLTVAFRAPTVRELAAYIDDLAHVDARLLDELLVPMNRGGDGPPVFAFPPGSGYCLAYQRLAALAPFPLHGFAFLEDEARDDEYVRRIRETADGPYVLLGYSSGGKLAFRVAQALERSGARVSDVVLLDAARYLRKVVFTDEEIRHVAGDFLSAVTSSVLREKALARMTHYRRFLGNCVESGIIAANIHLIAASGSPDVIHDASGTPIATLTGWSELTTGRFVRHQGSGAHREMLEEGHVEANAETIAQIVRSSESRPSP